MFKPVTIRYSGYAALAVWQQWSCFLFCFFFYSFSLVKSTCGCRAQFFIMEAIAVLIKMECYFKLFIIGVEQNEGGRVRVKVDMS